MGYNVDKTANLFPEGMVLLEVMECTDGHSKKPPNHGYFKVKLRDIHSGRTLYEVWMMEGAGQGMTVPKLHALEIDMDNPVEAHDLLGRRMIARIKHKESEEYGTQAQIAKAWSEAKPPAEWKEPEDTAPLPFDKGGDSTPDSSIPF